MSSKRKAIAYAFSDLHINDWAKFNKQYCRTVDAIHVLTNLNNMAREDDALLFFCGDLLHKPESMSIQLHYFINYCTQLANFSNLYAITGNHDTPDRVQYYGMTKDAKYFSWVKQILGDCCVDFKHIEKPKLDLTIHAVPYLDHNAGLNLWLKETTDRWLRTKRNILLMHTDYPGAKDPDGTEVGTCEQLDTKLLEPFDLVLCGHIHKPQKLAKNVYMLGAPMQQRRSDSGCKMGYWKIWEDFTMTFYPLSQPEFIDVESEDQIKDNINYYTVIPPKQEKTALEDMPVISSSFSTRKMVRAYMKSINETDKEKRRVLNRLIKEAEE